MNRDTETTLNLTHMVRPAIERERGERGGEGAAGPCLLLLHGRGADEADLMGLEGALDPRLTVVSARAPFRLGPGFAWYGMSVVGKPDNETLRASLDELRDFVQGLPEAYNLDPARIYLMGFSQGAVMSAALAMTSPHLARGVVMHSGYAPANAGLDLREEGLQGKPFFVAHGKYDDVIPITFGRDSQEYLEGAGAAVTYQEYPIGHSISEESLYDVSEWLTTQLDRDQD